MLKPSRFCTLPAHVVDGKEEPANGECFDLNVASRAKRTRNLIIVKACSPTAKGPNHWLHSSINYVVSPAMEEEQVWSGSPSQVVNMATYIACALIALISLSMGVFVAVIGALVIAPWALWTFLKTKNTRYVLTTQRLTAHRGVLSKSMDEFELYRVRDSRVDQPLFLRLFSLGNILVVSSDAVTPNMVIRAVSMPAQLREQVRKYSEARRDTKRVRDVELS